MNLITGATGHIGNVLARNLLDRGERVRTIVLPDEDLAPIEDLDIDVIEGDILDQSSVQKAVQGVDRVYHLAGLISILPGKDEKVHRVNFEGTRNVLMASLMSGVKRFIYTSSIHALANVPHGITIDEHVPFDPEHPAGEYARSKAKAALAVRQATKLGLDTVIACPTGVIGPYDYKGSEMGLLLADCLEEKTQLYIDGAYDFVDVRDVAHGLILAANKGKTGESYILSGEQISVRDLLLSAQKSVGKSLSMVCIPRQLASFAVRFTPSFYRIFRKKPRLTPYSLEVLQSNSVISHAKATRALGYWPRPLDEAIRDTLSWFKMRRLGASNIQF
jgi:dihydroflavonol-4-reductase